MSGSHYHSLEWRPWDLRDVDRPTYSAAEGGCARCGAMMHRHFPPCCEVCGQCERCGCACDWNDLYQLGLILADEEDEAYGERA